MSLVPLFSPIIVILPWLEFLDRRTWIGCPGGVFGFGGLFGPWFGMIIGGVGRSWITSPAITCRFGLSCRGACPALVLSVVIALTLTEP